MFDLIKKAWGVLAKIGDVVGPIEDFLVLLKLYHHDSAGNKVPDPKQAPRWAKKKDHEITWGMLTNRLSSGDQTEILQAMFPQLHELQQTDFIISAASMAASAAPTHAPALNPFDETVKKLQRIAAIRGADDNKTHELRVKEADALNFIKDPVEEYLLYRIEKEVGQQFADVSAFTRWVAREGMQVVKTRIADINAFIDGPLKSAVDADLDHWTRKLQQIKTKRGL